MKNLTDRMPRFLRLVLFADAVTSGATGMLMILSAGFLEQLLGVPAALLRYSGFGLLPFAAVVSLVAARTDPSRGAVWAILVLNALWAADSILILLTGWIEPTGLGYAFIIGQALVVAAFAELQYVGLRKFHPTTA